VHLWTGGVSLNLDRAATAVALSPARVAALVSESQEGGTDLNGDFDPDDTVLEVYDRVGAAWTSTGEAADAVDVVGSNVVYIQPEAAQGEDRTTDGDFVDRVIALYDAAADAPVPILDGSSRCSRPRVRRRSAKPWPSGRVKVISAPRSSPRELHRSAQLCDRELRS
jgi:hypothetical protein